LQNLITLVFAMALEAEHKRESFYVGGGYVKDPAGGHVFVGQMYVEKLTPSGEVSQPYPLVLIHGQAQTGIVRQPPIIYV
jgi:hypothetical protein